VRNPAGRLVERFIAVVALVRAFSGVDTFVHAHARWKAERFGTERAVKRSLSGVAQLVLTQRRCILEQLRATRTLVRAFARTVSRFVRFQACNSKEELRAVGALEAFFLVVDYSVDLDAFRGGERFSAVAADVRC